MTYRIPPSLSFTFLLLLWFASNNIYAIDAELLFRRFPIPHLYIDLTLIQTLLGIFFTYVYITTTTTTTTTPTTTPTLTPIPPKPERPKFTLLLIIIGILHFSASLLTNVSYSLIGSTSTLIWKLTEPVSAILLKRLILGQVTNLTSLTGVFVTLSGVILFSKSSFTLPNFSPIILSNLFFPARNVFIKRSQLAPDNRSAATTFLYMLLTALPLSTLAFFAKLMFFPPPQFSPFCYMLRNALLFNTYHIASFCLLQRLDALTHSLFNTLKRFTAILLSMFIIKSPLHPHHFQGIAFTAIGFVIYFLGGGNFRQKLPNHRTVVSVLVALVIIISAFLSTSIQHSETPVWSGSNYVVMRGLHYRTIIRNIENHTMKQALLNKEVDLNIGNLAWLYAVDEQLPDFSHLTLCSSSMSSCAAVAKEKKKKLVHYRPVANILNPGAPQKFITAYNDMRKYIDEVLFLGLGAQVFFKRNQTGAAFIPGATITSSPSDFRLRSDIKAFFDLLGKRGGQMLVRGDLTHRITQRFGFRGAYSVGCPSLWINRDIHLGKTLEEKYRVIAERVGDRTLKIAVNFKFMPGYDRQLAYIRDNYPNARYYPQNEGDVATLQRMNVSSDKVKWFTNVDDWMADLREMDISYGLRIHGNMIAVGAGLPAIVVAPDWRVLELAQVMKIPHFTTYDKIFSEGVDVARLVKLMIEEFRGEEFDRNRCELAKVYIKVFKKYGIGVQKHVKEISGLC